MKHSRSLDLFAFWLKTVKHAEEKLKEFSEVSQSFDKKVQNAPVKR